MVPLIWGVWFVNRSCIGFARLAAVAALATALALAACGRKGLLDPPPSASLATPQQVTPQPSLGEQPPESIVPGHEEQPQPARPQAPPARPVPNKRIFLDPLLD